MASVGTSEFVVGRRYTLIIDERRYDAVYRGVQDGAREVWETHQGEIEVPPWAMRRLRVEAA